MSDPRIIFLKKIIELLHAHGDLPTAASFRLKRLEDWTVPTNAYTLLSQMSWSCGTNCVFCFQKGCPPGLRFKKRGSREEIITRLKYYDQKKMRGLVGDDVWEGDEILNNPFIFEVLKTIRKKGERGMLKIVTNGTSLTEERIKALSKLGPLLMVISLNSADPKRRKDLMNDPCPETAIHSLPLLKKYRIPYIVSVVAWYGLPFSDILKTIRYADEHDACFTRLLLTGFSKYFPLEKKFNAKKLWNKVIEYFGRNDLSSIPPVFLPSASAQQIIFGDSFRPFIMGIFKNSPAHSAGLQRGDLILEINGQGVASIEEANKELSLNNDSPLQLKIKRESRIIKFELNKRDCYPFCLEELHEGYPFGIFLTKMPIKQDEAMDIQRYISLYEAKRVLVFASRRAKPLLRILFNKLGIPAEKDVKLTIRVAKNRFFGGSVDTGDLLTVQDYIDAVNEHKNYKPDLVLLPASAFSKWGRDLTGRNNQEIERKTGVRTEFIYNVPDYIKI